MPLLRRMVPLFAPNAKILPQVKKKCKASLPLLALAFPANLKPLICLLRRTLSELNLPTLFMMLFVPKTAGLVPNVQTLAALAILDAFEKHSALVLAPIVSKLNPKDLSVQNVVRGPIRRNRCVVNLPFHALVLRSVRRIFHMNFRPSRILKVNLCAKNARGNVPNPTFPALPRLYVMELMQPLRLMLSVPRVVLLAFPQLDCLPK